jgi:hypothetical protein
LTYFKLMKFYSARSWWISLIIWGALALLVFSVVEAVQQSGVALWSLFLSVLAGGLLLWMWLATFYRVIEKDLYYRSGPFNGSLPINSIRTITTGKTMYVGMKPALATKGCIIEYNKYDDIYLSPQDQEGFIAALLSINPNIKVVRS